jgi:protein TonB
MALALATSAIAHLFLIQSLIFDVTQRSVRTAGAPTITVHLELPAGPVIPKPEPLPTTLQMKPRAASEIREAAALETGVRPGQDAIKQSALPQAPDPTYYAARDLDVYPRPIAPFDFDRLARGAASRFRLALLIDEAGVVKEIAVVEIEPAGRLQEELRSVLAATRFFPGQKDGRAVKSRVLLSVSLDPARGEGAGR